MAFLAVMIALPHSAWAGKRIALVIGNSSYAKISSLKNARNDAALMAATLRQLDFDVVEALDVDRAAMARAVRAFGGKLRDAGADAVGLFYYAGHGVQARGVNYMVPVSASIDTESDLEVEALPADSVLSQMRDAGNATSIIILDACRNNPFAGKTRSATRGLARVSATGGAIVAFSAAPGQVASDGEGDNSPYTTALSKAMQAKGLTIEQVFKRVLVDVENATAGEQVPWVESSLRDDFYFQPAAMAATPLHHQLSAEATAWAELRESTDADALQGFILAYPDSVFADVARMRLDDVSGAKTPAPSSPASSSPASASPAAKPQILAALTPAEADPPPPPDATPDTMTDATPDPMPDTAPDLASGGALYAGLQRELNRLGCWVGEPDGKWGRRSEEGLARLRSFYPLELPSEKVDPAGLLDDMRNLDGKLCPTTCSILEEERNGVCIAKTCPAGQQLSGKGVCFTPAKTASRPKPAGRPKAARNCWTLIDEVICE
ncbi:caspase domain-containing protein [Ancylobacter sp. IITR112]|uniref:caspase family protein n=1 Tax=Ancylobacter sp. IITR112 TaxID=3138073 RepID=UPI003529DF92